MHVLQNIFEVSVVIHDTINLLLRQFQSVEKEITEKALSINRIGFPNFITSNKWLQWDIEFQRELHFESELISKPVSPVNNDEVSVIGEVWGCAGSDPPPSGPRKCESAARPANHKLITRDPFYSIHCQHSVWWDTRQRAERRNQATRRDSRRSVRTGSETFI